MSESKPRRQCKACPWKKGVKPERDIPGGYCEIRHKNLRKTIARSADPSSLGRRELPMMACHESNVGEEQVCVGWAMHQLGPGNNLAMRLRAMSNKDLQNMETVGPQHQRFEDTLPKHED